VVALSLDQLPPVPGVEHRFLTAGGSRLHVAEAGTGPPVLLLHGWPQHWYLWREVIPRLSDEHRVVCPDLPGFGWSDPAPRGYAKERLAEQMLALLDELDLERVLIVGHDWGAWIGFLLCLRAPERFERFLAMDAPHPFQPSNLRRLLGLWRLWYQVVLAAPALGERALRQWRFHERMLRAAAGPDFRWPEDVLEAFVAPITDPAVARASVEMYRTFLMRELIPVAAGRYRRQRLRVPTLLLAGELDPVARPEMLYGAGDNAPHLSVEILPRVGHFLVDEQPEVVAARVRALSAAPDSGQRVGG
jgi:pimeloyl-ACP methyl ester carboxylesterase